MKHALAGLSEAFIELAKAIHGQTVIVCVLSFTLLTEKGLQNSIGSQVVGKKEHKDKCAFLMVHSRC